jgi:hypothetical protein
MEETEMKTMTTPYSARMRAGGQLVTVEVIDEDDDFWTLRDPLGVWTMSKDDGLLWPADGVPLTEIGRMSFEEVEALGGLRRAARRRSNRAEKMLSGWTPTSTVISEQVYVDRKGWVDAAERPRSVKRERKQSIGPVYRMKPIDRLENGVLVNAHGNVKKVQHDDKTIMQMVDGDWIVVRQPK